MKTAHTLMEKKFHWDFGQSSSQEFPPGARMSQAWAALPSPPRGGLWSHQAEPLGRFSDGSASRPSSSFLEGRAWLTLCKDHVVTRGRDVFIEGNNAGGILGTRFL